MAITSVQRRSSPNEIAREMDRRGDVILRLEGDMQALMQRAEAAEARVARLAEMNERMINETHASWMAARADADGWHRSVEMILTIAGLSPALGAAEAVQAMREELERRVLSARPSPQILAEARHPSEWATVSRAAREVSRLDQDTLAASYNDWICSLPENNQNPHQFLAYLKGVASMDGVIPSRGEGGAPSGTMV